MTNKPAIPELDYLPTRNGGPDQLHTHLSFKPSTDQRESCGACAQTQNDFAWAGLHDTVDPADFGPIADAMTYAMASVTARRDPRTARYRDRETAVA